jgi:hypothetical protein
MTTVDLINLAALLLSPVIAVLVTLWLQGRKETRDRKERLFEALMKHRMANPRPPELVHALNLIDVVFKSNDEVRRLWKDYFGLLCRAQPSAAEFDHQEAKYLELLSAISRDLGYAQLQQTDIARFYVPRHYENEFGWMVSFRSELLRVLQNTGRALVTERDDVAAPREKRAVQG